MRFSLLKHLYLASLSLAASILIGQQPNQDSLNKTPSLSNYSSPCRIEVQSPYNLYLLANFIYWQPIQENMELGVINDSSSSLVLVEGTSLDLSNKYKPGFQVALGMNFNHDAWDSYLQYTWFQGTNNASLKLDPNSQTDYILPSWQAPDFLNPQYNLASERWTLKMDLIDWDLGRNTRIGSKLCLRQSFGLRYALIRQTLSVEYVNENSSDFFIWPSTSIHQTTRGFGIGPQVAFLSQWSLVQGFRIDCSGEADILFTQYDLRSFQSSNTSDPSQYNIKQNNTNYLRAHSKIALGLNWGSYFLDNKCHFDLCLGYNFQVFWDQNMFRVPTNTLAMGRSTIPNGNLYISGLTVSTRFDF